MQRQRDSRKVEGEKDGELAEIVAQEALKASFQLSYELENKVVIRTTSTPYPLPLPLSEPH